MVFKKKKKNMGGKEIYTKVAEVTIYFWSN